MKKPNSANMKKFFLLMACTVLGLGSCTERPRPLEIDNALTAEEIAAGRFTPEVMWKMGRLGGSQLSPDGKWLVYTVTYYNLGENRGVTALYLRDMASGEVRQLTDHTSNNTSPAWSADGRTLYFLSDRSGTQQVWRMAAAGGAANLAKHYRETSFFGIVQVLKNLRTIKRQMLECQADVAAFAPDVLILVDYPGFNMKMARWAKEHGIRTFYYIAPKVWAWREWRVKAIRKYVDRLFIIFPFERSYFPRHGIEPIFEGNPLVDAIEAKRAALPSPDEFRRRNGLDGRPIVALLAGSRRGEIRDNLPLMADLSKKFPGHQFVVAGVSWLDRALYEQYMAGSDIRYVCDQTYETLAAAEAAVVTSGTATLETALLGIPEVVVYRTLWFQVKLQPYVLNVPWVSLVNLNLGREAVAEIIQSGLDITRAERELRAVVEGGSKREKMLSDFDELRKVIGGPGASDRFAARMVAELHATEAQ